ncbi:MAG: lecithin retinol acyltransferase family protein [Eubacteriales bacterium]
MPSDHLVVNRGPFDHHGIFMGNSQVIHLASDRNVHIDTIEDFVGQGKARRRKSRNSSANDTAEEILRSAMTCIERKDKEFKSWEHFANWCRRGEKC